MANEETGEKLNIELEAPADSTSSEGLYLDLIKTICKYRPSGDITMIQKIYKIANEAHRGRRRKSGEPYIIHLLCVAIILANLEIDKETITAGPFHDVVEDTIITLDQLTKEFGSEVSFLVDDVTKLIQLNRDRDKVEIQADDLRRMFLVMAENIRVTIIKLADRLYNMRIGQYRKPEKQKEKARETVEIYAPVADRLGISKIKIELNDLLLKFLKPEVYYDLVEEVGPRKDARETFAQEVVDEVKSHMKEAGVEATVGERIKHSFSIYKGIVNQNKTLNQIYDLFAVRIMVEVMKDCYAALGVTHEMYGPIPGRFKDYIAMPKQNMYRSLHTALIRGNRQPFEIQIRIYEMHRAAGHGIITHWRYKESGSRQVQADNEETKLSWLYRIPEWQRDMDDSKKFLSMVKGDLDSFPDSMYYFTPPGDVEALPNDFTPTDFAYYMHSVVRNKMVEARVDGKLVLIEYVIQNGGQLGVIISQNPKGSSRDRSNVIKSTQAKNKINRWFENRMKEDNIVGDRDAIERYCETKNVSWPDISKLEFMERVMNRCAFKDRGSALAPIRRGGMKEGQVINRTMEEQEKEIKREITDEDVLKGIADTTGRSGETTVRGSRSGIVVKGIHDLAVRFSKCCNSVPGDETVGLVTRGWGVFIRRTDCIDITNLPEDKQGRLTDAKWQVARGAICNKQYSTEIKIFTSNRIDMFADISKAFAEKQIDIASMNVRTSKRGKVTIIMTFDIHDTEELDRLAGKMRQTEGVLDIERTMGRGVDEYSSGPGNRCQFTEAGGSQTD